MPPVWSYRLGRRGLLASGAVMTTAAGLSACSGGAQATDGETRPIKTIKGTVDVPVKPKSVVCLEQYSTFNMYDFGLKPAATIEDIDMWVYEPYAKTYEKSKKVGSYEGDIDAIAAAAPDLIFGLEVFHGKIYDDLSKLAPTVMHDAKQLGPIPWKETSKLVAETLGVESKHKKLVSDYEDAVDKVVSKRGGQLFDLKISLVSGVEGKWTINYPTSWSGIIIEDLGGKWGEASAGKKENSENMSYEQLDVLSDSDIIFYVAASDGIVDQPTKALLDQPAYKALPAVKAGNSFALKDFYAFHYTQATHAVEQIGDFLGKV